MIYDSAENVEAYGHLAVPLPEAVRFARTFDPARPDGRYPIDGEDVFAIVQSLATSPDGERPFEAHRRYVDVQMVLEGAERHDVVLLDGLALEPLADYDRQKDVQFFPEPKEYSSLVLTPGRFVLYGPGDGHRPGGSVDAPRTIRKVCVKIRI